MLCCVLPLVLLGVARRVLRLDGRGRAPMPPPARRDVDVDGLGRSLVEAVR